MGQNSGRTGKTISIDTCRDKSDRVFTVEEPCPDTRDNCWESCELPGPNCTACSGSDYILCPETNTCFHPSLKCDGTSQCKGVDDNLDECLFEYRNNNDKDGRHKISQYATFRCKRISNSDLETYATACDGNPECMDKEDETLCNQTSDFIKYSLPSFISF